MNDEKNWETLYSEDYVEGISGWKETYYKGKSHSRNDEPSWIYYYKNGDKTLGWDKEGLWHRLAGPAIILYNGNKEYYIEGDKYKYEDWLEERKNHPDWNDSMLDIR